MEIKKIYFDMDGVLADFDLGIDELTYAHRIDQKTATKEENDAIWDAVRPVEHFYDKLKIMPGAKEMFDAIYEEFGDRCEILTGVPKPKRNIKFCCEDKVNWTHRLLNPDIVVNTVYRAQKKDFCTGADCILIDDLPKNIAEWEEAGGTGIYHTDPVLTLQKLQEIKNK